MMGEAQEPGEQEAPLTVPLEGAEARGPALVGGKAAGLGALLDLGGVHVPAGFCLTTEAFELATAEIPGHAARVAQLDRLRAGEAAGELAAEIRAAIRTAPLPGGVIAAVAAELAVLPTSGGVAVRSSAAAEDSIAESFAGQHDSLLEIRGAAATQEAIRAVWASLYSERAVAYRLRHGRSNAAARMAVVIQRMLAPTASGVLFTADPVTGHRATVMIEAVAGRGDALVAGTATPERIRVRGERIVERGVPALSEAQIDELVRVGRRIATYAGAPQDLEWCIAEGALWIVQRRPITTLYPIPAGADDGAPHVYVSVGHGQMMTDAMTPLGLSVFQLTALPPMLEAGSRLFVDVAPRLASPARDATVAALEAGDPLIGDALRTLIARDGFLPRPDPAAPPAPAMPPAEPLPTDPAIVAELIARSEAVREALASRLDAARGVEVFAVIRDDLQALKRSLVDPIGRAAVLAGMDASAWLNRQLEAWLGERNVADVLTRSAPGNVTSEMGLALLDVADALRPHAEVVALIERGGDDIVEQLRQVPGGAAGADALEAFLARYGMRCAGEIDLARPRWAERPSQLLPLLLGNIRNARAGASAERFAQGRREAEAKADDVLRRVRALPDGDAKAAEVERMIAQVRTFIGYREYPKYDIVARSFLAKQALHREVRTLVAGGVLAHACDAAFLRFEELEAAVRDRVVDPALIARRRVQFAIDEARTPPRVLTSDGEVVPGRYRRADPPAGALVGVAVSSGTVAGRARVVHRVHDAQLDPGDILVTRFTDPSWSPVFVTVAALVAEVGGAMTHGAVIAREYGLPAVVGVERATELIRDGERIRVHGADGYVERLERAR
jgi:pyruvate,water dikinase